MSELVIYQGQAPVPVSEVNSSCSVGTPQGRGGGLVSMRFPSHCLNLCDGKLVLLEWMKPFSVTLVRPYQGSSFTSLYKKEPGGHCHPTDPYTSPCQGHPSPSNRYGA